MEQIAGGGPATVTHPDASRYFITLSEAVEIIMAAVSLADTGVFIPKLGEQIKILELAKRMIAAAEKASGKKIHFEFVALRPGEKLTEELVSENESTEPTRDASVYRVRNAPIENAKMDRAVAQLSLSVGKRDLAGVLEIISSLVPEYVPSESMLGFAKAFMVRERT
jgi:FlaA1/EpsC-like NDP-sugar epimerase